MWDLRKRQAGPGVFLLLPSLQRKEFLYEQPALPESEYIFKHASTPEEAYNSFLKEDFVQPMLATVLTSASGVRLA
jgi:hypothetical protein